MKTSYADMDSIEEIRAAGVHHDCRWKNGKARMTKQATVWHK